MIRRLGPHMVLINIVYNSLKKSNAENRTVFICINMIKIMKLILMMMNRQFLMRKINTPYK